MSKAMTNNLADVQVDASRRVVPQSAEDRDRIRARALRLVRDVDRGKPLTRADLLRLGSQALADEGLPSDFLGFAMVALDNEFWRDQFAAVPFSRRLLMLPHCLRRSDACLGHYDQDGLNCAGCGRCPIGGLKAEAEALGYSVLVAEGTPAVVEIVLRGSWGAILGVACMESLDKAFDRISEVGMPHTAIPLLRDGCVDTEAELDEVRRWLVMRCGEAEVGTRAFFPLLRQAVKLFDEEETSRLLAGSRDALGPEDPREATERIALDWLRQGGKRLRPFVTLAAFAALRHGMPALQADADARRLLPLAVRRVAFALEAMHKASLAHDDIEDDDLFRYGVETLHRRYGVPVAINIGDYLVGLGYRIIAGEARSLGAECAADILARLSQTHVKLSRGQGAELRWSEETSGELTPLAALKLYALKTAPAFEMALYAGARMAGPLEFSEPMRLYCRRLGVAYQARNDLKDWRREQGGKIVAGQDALASRPTLLRAFALERLTQDTRRDMDLIESGRLSADAALERARSVCEATGAFRRTELLIDRQRERALQEARKMKSPAMRELLSFVAEVTLA